jgi:hypothetical protein
MLKARSLRGPLSSSCLFVPVGTEFANYPALDINSFWLILF